MPMITNAELAQNLRDLRDFLIIAGYEESHATRYTNISRAIDKLPESVHTLRDQGRLGEIPGVGKLIQTYIKEILDTGVSSKQTEWEEFAPMTVLQLVRMPGVGAKTARRLYQEFGIDSLTTLKLALETGTLEGVSGIGPKMQATFREATGLA